MGKPTKRERKFQASGGIKRRLEKGTITNKGKLKKRKKRNDDGTAKQDQSKLEHTTNTSDKLINTDSLMGGENIAEMDMSTFFEKLGETIDQLPAGDKEEDQEDDVACETQDNDDDDEEDLEAGLKEAEKAMKREMKKMNQSDPEFHSFLRENEAELLEFGQDEEPKEEGRGDTHRTPSGDGKFLVTREILKSLVSTAFEDRSLKGLWKMVSAFRAACYLADSSGSRQEGKDSQGSGRYVIDSAEIYDELMLVSLERCHEEFQFHIFGHQKEDEDNEKQLTIKVFESSPKWKVMRPIVLSFLRSLLHVLYEAKDPALLAFVLKSLSHYMRYLKPYPRMTGAYLKRMTTLWSALNDAPEYRSVVLQAFLRIRQLCLTQPYPFIEEVLKRTYLAYAKRANFVSASSANCLTLMGNCLCELYSLDPRSSYQPTFVYIRQLALLLRAAMHKKTPEAIQRVYSWQFVHCLKLWVAVLCEATSNEGDAHDSSDALLLRSLVYPVTEIIIGVIRFAPSPIRHAPLRFHCVRLLQQLAAATNSFIPTATIVLDCLEWKEWFMPPKKTRTKSERQFDLVLKLVPKEDALRIPDHLENCMDTIFLLLNREIELYKYSASFPEFSIRIIQRLQHFSKSFPSPRWRSLAKNHIERCKSYASVASKLRSKLSQGPADVDGLECLLPAGEERMDKRHAASVEQEQQRKRALMSNDAESLELKNTQPKGERAKRKPARSSTRQSSSRSPNASKVGKDDSDLDEADVLAMDDEIEDIV